MGNYLSGWCSTWDDSGVPYDNIEETEPAPAGESTSAYQVQRSQPPRGESERMRKDFEQVCRRKDDEISKLKQQLKEVEGEKNTVITRLSENMSEKLRFKNPYIVDLSDSNRPVKLAERFSELYDNEWTDAFDSIDNYDVQREATLLSIVMEVFKKCQELSMGRKRKLKEAFYLQENHAEIADLPIEIQCKVQELNSSASLLLQDAIQLLASHVNELGKQRGWTEFLVDVNVQTYVKKCAELCWLMTVCEPPVHLASDPPKDGLFTKDRYKEYTSSGLYVSEVIWPVMELYKGGPLLGKGVVQCYNPTPPTTAKGYTTSGHAVGLVIN